MKKYANKEPLVCQINLDNPDKEPIYFGNDFKRKVYSNDSIEVFNFPNFKIENKYLFYVIEGYGKILVIDLDKNEIFKILDIEHNNRHIGIDFCNFIDFETSSKISKEVYERGERISNIVWDKFQEKYYIFIHVHKKSKSNQVSFMQIWDKDLNFQKEIKFNGKKEERWYYRNIIITDKGLMIKYDTPDSKSMVYKKYNINL